MRRDLAFRLCLIEDTGAIRSGWRIWGFNTDCERDLRMCQPGGKGIDNSVLFCGYSSVTARAIMDYGGPAEGDDLSATLHSSRGRSGSQTIQPPKLARSLALV